MTTNGLARHLASAYRHTNALTGEIARLRDDLDQATLLISELRRQYESARRASITDPLTGRLNRDGLLSLWENPDAWCQHVGSPIGLILLDLDGFKAVNDTFGHAVGDVVLQHVGDLIHNLVGNRVARLGGDEFAVLVECGENTRILANLISGAIETSRIPVTPPVHTGTRALQVRTSAGWVTIHPGDRIRDVLLHADIALYHAKTAGKSRSWWRQLVGRTVEWEQGMAMPRAPESARRQIREML